MPKMTDEERKAAAAAAAEEEEVEEEEEEEEEEEGDPWEGVDLDEEDFPPPPPPKAWGAYPYPPPASSLPIDWEKLADLARSVMELLEENRERQAEDDKEYERAQADKQARDDARRREELAMLEAKYQQELHALRMELQMARQEVASLQAAIGAGIVAALKAKG